MFGVSVTLAAVAAICSAPAPPRAVIVAWDASRSSSILSQIDSKADTDTLRKLAREAGYRLEFMGGDAYCFQNGMMGESDLLAQRALFTEIARTAGSQKGAFDHRRVSQANWTALRLHVAAELAKEGITEKDLESSRIVLLPDYRIQMRSGERTQTFFPATASQPQASEVVDAPAVPRASWNPSLVRTKRLQTSMTVFAADLGPLEQAVLMRQATEMMEHYIDQLVTDVAVAAQEAYQKLAKDGDPDQKIDPQASTLDALAPEQQIYLSGAFANAYRWMGFADVNQARAFVSVANFERIEPVLVMLVTVPLRNGTVRTYALVFPPLTLG